MHDSAYASDIEVRIDESDRRRWSDALKRARADGANRWVYWLCAVGWGTTATLRLTFVPHTLHAGDVAYASLAAIIAIANVVVALARRTPSIVPVRTATLDVGDDGVTMRGEQNRSIRWTSVERIVDVGDAFIIERRFNRPAIAVPKRALPNGGIELWSFFERRLLGTRMLSRPDRTAPIVNVTSASSLLRVR